MMHTTGTQLAFTGCLLIHFKMIRNNSENEVLAGRVGKTSQI